MYVFDEVTSTQDVAASMFAGEPLLVIAGRQLTGRGRSGSEWVTAPRALAASLAIETPWPGEFLPIVPLIAGMAAAALAEGKIRLKWPNDLEVDGDKVGGILSETSRRRVIVGLGVNLYWPDPPLGVRGLFASDPGPDEAGLLARGWADRLAADLLRDRPVGWNPEAYRRLSSTIGRQVRWDPSGSGRAIGIDESGGLVVEVESGELIRLSSGEVRHVRSVG